MVKKYKSRKISFIEYFESLQREYVVSELRYKIYSNEKDKQYYRDREMLGKRQKIEDISLRNNLENIFTSEYLRCKFYDEVYNKSGLPNFLYRDENDKAKRGNLDIYNYFAKDTLVTVLYNECCMKGKIEGVNIKEKYAIIYIFDLEKSLNVSFEKIVRHDLI